MEEEKEISGSRNDDDHHHVYRRSEVRRDLKTVKFYLRMVLQLKRGSLSFC